jgi:uncharacterized protein
VHPNPFIYSHPLSPEEIINRDGETDALLQNAVGGHFVRLFAPRKYGKTSLLRRALREGEHREALIPILVDLYRISSVADAAIRFERAYSRQLKGALRSKVEDFLQKTGIGLSLGAYGISAKLQLGSKVDPLPALHALLDLPLRLEEGGGYRALIALDEFQDIHKVPDLDGLIRSHIQFQGEVASYVFAGSEPGMMRQLFERKDRPLYGSAVPMRLGRLAREDIATHVSERFEQTGRRAGEALGPLLDAGQGHPQRAMLLAHHLWDVVPQDESGSLERWREAHTRAMAELEPEFDAQWRAFDTSEQKTMRALIAGEGSPYRGAVLSRLELTKDMVRKALPRLQETGEIEKHSGKYAIVDPLLAQWLERVGEGTADELSLASEDRPVPGIT